MTDKLEQIFNMQLALQLKLGVKFDQDYINIMTLACEQELHEALRETPWKPWKKQQTFNRDNYKKELIDALHFFINLCLAGGITAEDLYEAYIEKNKENYVRKESGY
jgi:dimeric dUTPase (all-alpha-NTP-PPase superfamily)